MDNQRKFSRVPFSVKARLEGLGPAAVGEVADLSLQGMFLRTRANAAVGTQLGVTLELAGQSSELTVHLEGTVVRTTPEGLALRFTQVDLDSFIYLRNMLAYNTGDADKIDQEFLNYVKEKDSFVVHLYCAQ